MRNLFHCAFSLTGKGNKIFKRRGDEPLLNETWTRGKQMLIKKMFQLIYKENIEETKEVLRNSGRLSLPL